MAKKAGKGGKTSAHAHAHDDEHIDSCEIEFTERDATPDHELPIARGGVETARKRTAKRRR